MVSKVDWKALDGVYASSAPKPAFERDENAVPLHVKAYDDWCAAEERAAIYEYVQGMSRIEAEARAFAGFKGVCGL